MFEQKIIRRKHIFKTKLLNQYLLLIICFVCVLKMSDDLNNFIQPPNQSLPVEIDLNNTVFLLILTQIRSGSQITGRILNQIKDSFYTDEPVVEWGRLSFPRLPSKVMKLLQDIFSCRFSLRPKYYQQRIRPYFNHNFETRYIANFYPELALDPALEDVLCNISSVRIIRSVLTEARVALDLLKEEPNLRIIHLVRDPRASMHSRKVLALKKRNYGTPCERFQTDILWILKIRNRFANR